MRPRVCIVHGWSNNPDSAWIPWIIKELKERKLETAAPPMPDPDRPRIKAWVDKLNETIGTCDGKTFFIGHSIGCQTILRYLESLGDEVKAGGAVLVAPFIHLNISAYEDREDVETAKEWLNKPLGWEKILKHTKNFVTIFSDDDPYVPLADSDIFSRKLKAKVVIEKNRGHLDDYSHTYKLESALSEIIEMIENVYK